MMHQKTKSYLPHLISSLPTVIFGICLIIFSIWYSQDAILEETQKRANCIVFSCQAISNASCPYGFREPCSTYNMTYYVNINGTRYDGNFYRTGNRCITPYQIYCYYWNTMPPDVQLMKYINDPALIILFTLLFLISLCCLISVFRIWKGQKYSEII